MICRRPLWGAVPFGWERQPDVAELNTMAICFALGMSQADAREYGLSARRQARARLGKGPPLHRPPRVPQKAEAGA